LSDIPTFLPIVHGLDCIAQEILVSRERLHRLAQDHDRFGRLFGCEALDPRHGEKEKSEG
jgi:hypothetical protein